MKQFAEEYPDFPFVQVPLAQIHEMPILQARLAKFTILADGEFVQVPLAQITWYHHISMLPNKGRVCSSRHDPAIGCCRIPDHQDDRRTEIRTSVY